MSELILLLEQLTDLHSQFPGTIMNKFTYLGSTLSENAMIDDDISAHLVKASASFGRLTKRFLNECGVCLCTKINVHCAAVLEAWTPYRQLEQFHMRCLQQTAGIKWQDMVPNTEV